MDYLLSTALLGGEQSWVGPGAGVGEGGGVGCVCVCGGGGGVLWQYAMLLGNDPARVGWSMLGRPQTQRLYSTSLPSTYLVT